LLGLAAGPVRAVDHLLLTEFASTPTAGEFVEIFNPTGETIPLDDYFVTDMVFYPDSVALPSNPPPYDNAGNYWHIADGTLTANDFDFMAKFPDGTVISPGQTIVVAIADGAAFSSSWGGAPVDFQLPRGGPSSVTPMVDAGLLYLGSPRVGSAAGLSNTREIVVLFRWDGESDLVEDVDIVQWSDSGPVPASQSNNPISPCKTAITVGTSTYLDDTHPQDQAVVFPHAFGSTNSRFDFEETGEVLAGGNGITGHDETSEPYEQTWARSTPPSPGSPGPFGPPVILTGGAISSTRFDLVFSRELDPADANDPLNFQISLVRQANGTPVDRPVPLVSAELSADGLTVALGTGDQQGDALYEVRIVGDLKSEDGRGAVPAGSRIFLYGFRNDPVAVLDVPPHPFVPGLDGSLFFSYRAPQGKAVVIRMYDALGREVIVFNDRAPAGGVQGLRWDGRDRLNQRVAAGVYYLHLEVSGSGFRTVKPIVVGTPNTGLAR
jgi:hypothetical protein